MTLPPLFVQLYGAVEDASNHVLFASIVGPACVVGYITARIFLLVEVFLCLRSMPEDVHRTVLWTTWFPHI